MHNRCTNSQRSRNGAFILLAVAAQFLATARFMLFYHTNSSPLDCSLMLLPEQGLMTNHSTIVTGGRSSPQEEQHLNHSTNIGRDRKRSSPQQQQQKQQPYQSPPRHHAIVIPFRDRETHLKAFIQHMGPYLKRNFPHDAFSLFIMEQADDKLFNRGFLLNTGLTEIPKRSPGTHCVVLHDVDLIPKVDGVPYTSCDTPIQLGSELEHNDWSTPYPAYTGGIVSMHILHWRTINGMSNDYEGWGGEDDDLYHRLRLNKLLLLSPDKGEPEIVRPPKGKGAFYNLETLPVSPNSGAAANKENNPPAIIEKQPEVVETRLRKSRHAKYRQNSYLVDTMKGNSDRWRDDGLSDIDYQVMGDTMIQNVNGSDDFFVIHHIQVKAHANFTRRRTGKPGGYRRRVPMDAEAELEAARRYTYMKKLIKDQKNKKGRNNK